MTGLLAVRWLGEGSPSRSIKAHSRESLSCFSTLMSSYVRENPRLNENTRFPGRKKECSSIIQKPISARRVSVTSLVNPFVSSEMCHVSGYETSPNLHDEHPSDNTSRSSLRVVVFAFYCQEFVF